MAAQPAPAAPSIPEPVAASRPLTPLEAASRAVEAAPAKPSMRVGVAEPERTEGALALASAPAAEADLDHIAQAVCSALEREGHGTASVLLSSGNWTQQGDTIQVEVAIKRMMLSLTMNAEAEKICKNAMRSIGATQKLVFVPGEGNRAAGSKPAIAITGSIQSAALENPLVQKAKELFRGEIRSVLDLRDK